jgi:hypothetical protein
MRVLPWLVLPLGLVLSLSGPAGAACSSNTCTDLAAIDNIRAVVSAACDCSAADSHGKYVKCAKTVLKAAVKDGTLPDTCKKPVLKCEAKSTCGKPKSKICCVTSSKGKVKALAVRGSKCPRSGQLCDHPMALADACTAEGACTKRKGIRSFKSVQRVLQTSCALPSCHSTFGRQGDLVLETEDVSYKSLVNRPADLAEAAGLLRVKPGDPANSFLVKKLRGEGPGEDMPESGGPLAEPIIQMIEDWISRGALSTADECKPGAPGAASLCDDEQQTGGEFTWAPLPPLEAPAPSEGIQLYFPPKPVAPGTEWETCLAVKPNWTQIAQDIGLKPGGLPSIRTQTYRMHPGSHHLLLYAYVGSHPEQWPDGYFPCVAANCVNAEDCPIDADGIDDKDDPNDNDSAFVLPIGGTQVAGTRYEVKYPEGVGVPVLGPNMVLIINPHFTNPFQPPQEGVYGEGWLNLEFYKQDELKAQLDGIFAINYADLFVEPYQTRTISRIWQPVKILGRTPTDAAVFQLFGHMHKRATEFIIDYVRGGHCSVNTGRLCGRDSDCGGAQTCVKGPAAEDTTIYYTTAWDQAPIVDFPAPYFRVQHDEGLRWTCTHTNGVEGDPGRPPKKCSEGCTTCGWDPATRTCIFTRGHSLHIPGYEADFKVYQEGEPMPLVFGQLADDDMCNMFGYFINQADLAKLP